MFCNDLLRTYGTGMFHCGVEVHNREWSFEDRGIFVCRPRESFGHSYMDTVNMGYTRANADHIMTIIQALAVVWDDNYYDVFRHNCCHWCDAFCRSLGVGPIPTYTTSLVDAGASVLDSTRSLKGLFRYSCCVPCAEGDTSPNGSGGHISPRTSPISPPASPRAARASKLSRKTGRALSRRCFSPANQSPSSRRSRPPSMCSDQDSMMLKTDYDEGRCSCGPVGPLCALEPHFGLMSSRREAPVVNAMRQRSV